MRDNANNNASIDELSDDEKRLQAKLSAHLDGEVDELDFNVTSKLSAARHRALAQERSTSTAGSFAGGRFGWAATFASMAVVAIVLFTSSQFDRSDNNVDGDASGQLAQSAMMEDLNILTASDDIEFYQSLEFLEWMESNSG